MEDETFDVRWQRMRDVVTSTCNEVLGTRNTNHKGWIATETLNNIEETKAKKTAVNNSSIVVGGFRTLIQTALSTKK